MITQLSDRSQLTLTLLKAVLGYDTITGIFRWKVRLSNRQKVGGITGSTRKDGYVEVRIMGLHFLAHTLAYFYVHGIWVHRLDHRDRDTSNNRISNLRLATRSQNAANRGKTKNNTSGYKGVECSRGKKWIAAIKVQGKRRYLGIFDTREEVAQAYNESAILHFGVYAKVNLIESNDEYLNLFQ